MSVVITPGVFTTDSDGLVPAPGAAPPTDVLQADGTWAASGGGTDPPQGSYAPTAYTIATGKFRIAASEQQFTGTDELIIAGTGQLTVVN